MASIKFLLRSQNKNAQIYIRLIASRKQDFRKKTGLIINPKDWSIKTGLPKQNTPENKNLLITLKRLENFVLNKLNEDSINGIVTNGKWLQFQIDTFFNRIKKKEKNNFLTDYIQKVIDNAHTQVLPNGSIGLSNNRVKGLKTFKGLMERYEKVRKKRIKFSDIDYKFETHFRNWLLNDQEYKRSYASKNIENLKAICNQAKREGKNVNEYATQLKPFTEKKSKRIIQTLSFKELNKIEQLELKNTSLNNARKYIILGSYTGLRYSDLIRLKASNFYLFEVPPYIEIRQQKTGNLINIPILEPVNKIIKEGLPYQVSYQKLNEQIKQVCKLAGINKIVEGDKLIKLENGKYRKIRGKYPKYELISTHTFRRSFATNHYKLIPTPVLMEITGHQRESTFLEYINKKRDSKDNLKLFYEYLNKNKQKESKIISLQASNL